MNIQYTCVTCHLAFVDSDRQRDHYKTDWHRYNLKRKVESLPPVKLENFNLRKEALERELKEMNGEIEISTGYCVSCRKSFGNERAYENHINSKKHKEKLLKFEQSHSGSPKKFEDNVVEEEDDIEMVDSDEWDEEESIPVTDCLFCLHHSSNIQKNINHMGAEHSFFIPDIDYLVDVEGLLTYLGAKIGEGRLCLWCNETGKRFSDLSAVQKHMIDKGHCKILHEGDALIEYDDFYDYTSSYPEDDERDADSEVDRHVLDGTGYELVLPSGAKIGHRSLMQYYKQRLKPSTEIQLYRRSTSRRIAENYKLNGWASGSCPLEIKRKAKDIKFMRRIQQKYNMQLGQKANKLQKYRRDPTIVFG